MRPVFPSGKGVWLIGAVLLLLLSVLLYVGIYGGRVVSFTQEVWQPASSILQDNRKEPALNPNTNWKEPAVTTSQRGKKPAVIPSSPRKDMVDNTGAIEFLNKYKELFYSNRNIPVQTPNPNRSETITTWWQAAAMIDWYINSPPRYYCENQVSVGNWHICQDEPFTIKPPCLVYSFGIANDFSFDDDMAKMGCEVHSFDPSMNKDDHHRGGKSYFHNMGLSYYNTDGFVARRDLYVTGKQVWKIRTAKSVMKTLGHEKAVIDVFKMDVEGHEWAVLDNMMETGVFDHIRQFMLEFHLFPDFPLREEYVYIYNTYTRLREMGFREFNLGPHPKTLALNKFNNQGDSEYVNMFFERQRPWR